MTTTSPRLLRTGAAMLAIAPLALVTACSGVSGGGSGGGDSKSVSLLLVDQPATKELQSTIIPAFEKDTGIDVSVEIVPESGLDAKLATAVSADQSQYDVVMTGAKNWGSLVSAGKLRPIDDLMTAADTPDDYVSGFPTTLLENLTVDGASYAMPYQVGADMLFYNKDALSAAGVDTPPSTTEELMDAAKKLKAKGEVTPFVGRGSREGNENSFTWLMLWFLNGGRWPQEGKADLPADADALLEDPAITSTEQYLQLMGTYGPKGASSYTFAEAQKAMQDGTAGMWLDAAQLGPALEDEKVSKVAGKVGYAALTGEGGDDYIVGAVWGFSVAKASDNATDSWRLIEALTNKKTGVAQVLSGTNGSSGRTDVLEDAQVTKALDPGYVTALKEAVAHTNPAYTPLIPQGQQVRGALALALSQGLTDGKDAQATMTSASDGVRGIAK